MESNKNAIHPEPSEYAGKTINVSFKRAPNKDFKKKRGTHQFKVIDYWDRLNDGISWGESSFSEEAFKYADRVGASWPFTIPEDDEVLYGTDENGKGHLFHIKEIVESKVKK